MKIQAKDLWQLLYNAILFTDKKSAAGGVARFDVAMEFIWTTATDDHVAIRDCAKATVSDVETACFFLSLETMKALEKDLRDWQDELNLDVDTYGLQFGYFGTEDGHYVSMAEKSDPELWDVVGRMLSLKDFYADPAGFPYKPEGPIAQFALNPDRLRKFSLMKPGGFPIDMRYGYDFAIARDLVAFKAGPTLRGVLAPLDREILREKYGSEAGELLW